MTILHAISSLAPAAGGTVEWVRQCSYALQSMGHGVAVATLDNPGASQQYAPGLQVFDLGPGRGASRYAPEALPDFRRIASDFDAVIVHGTWQYEAVLARKALKGTQTPYYITPHGMLDPWFKRTYPAKHLKKCLYWPILYRVLRDSRAVLYTCEEERQLAAQSFWPYRCQTEICPLGIKDPYVPDDGHSAALEAVCPDLGKGRFLLFLSRIHRKKGCDILLEGFAASAGVDPEVHLVVAGPDSEGWQVDLRERARRLGIADRVHWPGMVRGEAKAALLHLCDAFVLPSHQETFPISAVEATAHGKPCLMTPGTNIWRDIVDDGAGLAEQDTNEGIARLFSRWFGLSQEDRASMGKRARSVFESRFEITKSVQHLVSVLERHRRADCSGVVAGDRT